MVAEAKEGKHLYGVIGTNEKRNFGPLGLGGRGDEVYTISYQDLAAVTSDTPITTYRSLDKEALVQHLASHQAVVEKVMKDYSVLPLKFGTVVATEEEVKNILEKGYHQFKRVLEAIDNKMELDVVALWNSDLIFKDILKENPEIQKFKQEMAGKSADETYNQRIELGKMVATVLDKKRKKWAQEIVEVLKDISLDFRLNRIVADKMVVNAAFLVENDKEREFDQEVNQLNQRYQERINFRCVGPLPPYSFSTLEIRRMEFKEVDEARKILGLGEEVTASEIKESYRKLTLKYHPDRNPNDPRAAEQFEKVSQAYQTLIDYCRHCGSSLRGEDVKNSIVVKTLELVEEEEGGPSL